MTPEQIARVIHAANREVQLILGDPSPSLSWSLESRFQQNSVIEGVMDALSGLSPEESHEEWRAHRVAAGWRYGPVKSETERTHPCLVPFDELPREQQAKDRLFVAIVRALADMDGPRS